MNVTRNFFFILLTQFINCICIVNSLFILGCSSEDFHIHDLKSKMKSECPSDWQKRDKWRRERSEAAEELGKINSDKAIKALVSGLKIYTNENEASNVLVNIGSSALPILIEALENRNENIRVNVVEILGEIGDNRAVNGLCETLLRNTGHICVDAARALAKIGDPKATTCLRNKLDNCSAKFRYVYAKALTELGDSKGIEILYSELKGGFEGLYSESIEDEKRKINAAITLADFGEKDMIPVLYDLIMNVKYVTMPYLIVALGHFGPDAFPTLLKLLENNLNHHLLLYRNNYEKRYKYCKEIIYALGNTGDKRAIPVLVKIIRQVPYVRNYYIRGSGLTRSEPLALFNCTLTALASFGKDAVPSLIALLKYYPSKDELSRYRRIQIIECLGRIDDKRASITIVKESNHRDPKVREAAERAMLKHDHDHDKDISALVNNLKMSSPSGKDICTFLNFRSSAVPILIEALENRNENIRVNAVKILGEIGDKRAVNGLCETLLHNTGHICVDAARALAKIGDPKATTCLRSKLDNYSANFRYVYAKALTELGDNPKNERRIKGSGLGK